MSLVSKLHVFCLFVVVCFVLFFFFSPFFLLFGCHVSSWLFVMLILMYAFIVFVCFVCVCFFVFVFLLPSGFLYR